MKPPRRRTLRDFCGPNAAWPLIGELREGTEVAACYVVHGRRRAATRNEQPYLDLRLGDRTGTIVGKVWDEVERIEPLCLPDEIVGVRGQVGEYAGRLQITIRDLEPLELGHDELHFFLPAGPRDMAEMERELEARIRGVADAPLRELLRRCLNPGSETGRSFCTHPAATRNHHAYVGGLLEHSLSVAAACDRLAEQYTAQGMRLDRDLLVAAALLHDLGKTTELASGRRFAYTSRGRLLGHIVIGLELVGVAAEAVSDLPEERLLLLLHLIASHQGKQEWGSPTVPQTLEALILHYADDLDAKLNPAAAQLAGVAPGEWTEYDRHLGRFLFRPPSEPGAAAGDSAGSVIDLFRG